MKARRIFWLLLLLMAAFTIHYRQVGFDIINLGYKFSRLHLAKQKVSEVRAGPDTIRLYIEAYPKKIEITDTEQLGIILKEAYKDYDLFLKKYYPEIFFGHLEISNKKSETLDFIFVSSTTYEALDRISQQHNSSAAYLIFFNTVYFKTYDSMYRVSEMRTTIRHEIFHYLNNYFGLTTEFEETAAKRFG